MASTHHEHHADRAREDEQENEEGLERHCSLLESSGRYRLSLFNSRARDGARVEGPNNPVVLSAATLVAAPGMKDEQDLRHLGRGGWALPEEHCVRLTEAVIAE
jgi:hypothetical protein